MPLKSLKKNDYLISYNSSILVQMKYSTFICLLKSCKNPIELLLANLELFHRWNWRWKIEFTLEDVQITVDQNHICVVTSNGNQTWYQNSKKHRDNDLPAIILSNGEQYWLQYGKQHRDHDRPAYIGVKGYRYWSKGTKCWYQYGNLHRDHDRPAFICDTGTQQWYQHGELHRDTVDPVTGNTLPAIVCTNGTQYWYKNGVKCEPLESVTNTS